MTQNEQWFCQKCFGSKQPGSTQSCDCQSKKMQPCDDYDEWTGKTYTRHMWTGNDGIKQKKCYGCGKTKQELMIK